MDDEAGPLANGSTADALETLRWDWGEAYLIEIDGDEWRAKRRDGLGGWIEAANPDGLDLAIKEDYALRRVPRDAEAQR
jgi:hypothetical protein